MKRDVRFQPRARQDLERLSTFLAERNPSAAERALETIRSAAASLDEFSDRGAPGGRRGLRRLIAPFGRAAYIIHYRVEPQTVIIVRVFHSRERGPLA